MNGLGSRTAWLAAARGIRIGAHAAHGTWHAQGSAPRRQHPHLFLVPGPPYVTYQLQWLYVLRAAMLLAELGHEGHGVGALREEIRVLVARGGGTRAEEALRVAGGIVQEVLLIHVLLGGQVLVIGAHDCSAPQAPRSLAVHQ